jgi:Leucine-rich repeat (LRR) protein
MLTLLTGMGAWAVGYNVKIGGVEITSGNYTAINYSNFPAIQSGTVTFNPSTNTLTLTNAVIESEDYAVQFNVSGRIVYNGTNTVTSTTSSAIYQNSEQLVIQGSGTLTANGSLNGNCGILINKNSFSTADPTLIINGEGGGTVIATGAYGISGMMGDTEQLVVNGATVHATGSTEGSICDLKSITLNDCSITSPANTTYTGGAVKAGGSTVTDEVVIQPYSVTGIPINENTFPDANFRSYVSSKDTNGDGYLSNSEIAAVETISIYNKSIASLEGIEFFTALTYLNCSNNQLTSLDLSQNTALSNLDCSRNQLTSLDVSQNTALTTLYCQRNQLTSLDVSHQPSLQNLSCFLNQISLDNMTALVESMPTKEGGTFNFYVYMFDANEQNVCMVPQARIAKAKGWTVKAYRGSTSEAYDGAPIPISAPYFPDAAFRTYLSSSNIDTDGDGALSETELAVNRITFNSSSTTTTLKGIEYFTALEYLTCNYNNLTSLDLTKNLALKDLRCSYNEQMQVLQLPNTTTLIDVACAHCSLLSLDVTMCKGLGTLRCDHNSLSTLYANNVTTLNELQCQNNSLTTLGITGCTNLRDVYANNNQLTALNLSGCTKLNELRIYSNQIKQQAMNNIITALPEKVSPATGSIVLFYTAGSEGNEYSDDNIEQAKLKRWFAYSNDGTEDQEIVPWYVVIEDQYYANFPSQYFRNYVKQHFDTDHNGVLNRQELEAVTTIDLSNHQVSNMKGVEFFPNLVTLNCSNCSLLATAQLDLSKNLKLKTLHCEGNSALNNIDLSNHTYIREIYCSECNLSAEAIQALINNLPESTPGAKVYAYKQTANEHNELCLTSEQVSAAIAKSWKIYITSADDTHTELTSGVTPISDRYFPDAAFRSYVHDNNAINKDGDNLLLINAGEALSVTELYLSGITISNLAGIEHFTNLSSLICTGIHLEHLDLTKNTELDLLKCDDNQLAYLDLSKNTKLRTFYCQNNQLAVLDVSGTDLYELQCYGNQIKGSAMQLLIDGLPADRTVREATLIATRADAEQDNDEPTLAQVQTAQAKRWAVLIKEEGDEQYSQIGVVADIDINKLNFPDDKFRNYISQKKDKDSDGKLSAYEIDQTTQLIIPDRGIRDLKGIEYFVQLEELNCNNNWLKTIDMSANKKLKELRCNNNLLNTLVLSQNKALEILDCSRNELTAVDLSQNTLLKEYNCSGNSIWNTFTLPENKMLTHLDCSNNYITNLDLRSNVALKEVYCQKNDIKDGPDSYGLRLPQVEGATIYYKVPNLGVEHNAIFTEQHNGIHLLEGGWKTKVLNGENWHSVILILDELDDDEVVAIRGENAIIGNSEVLSMFNWGVYDHVAARLIKNVTEIDVSGKTLAGDGIRGLYPFTNLTTLKCNGSQVSKLDLSYFPKLTRIECYNNQIQGEELQTFFDNLLDFSKSSDDHVIIFRSAGSNEQNGTPTNDQILIANQKGWNVYTLEANGTYTDFETPSVAINETNFPDENFRNYVKTNFDKNSDNKLSYEELKAVKEIRIYNKGIANLKGIEHFLELTVLNCDNNPLNDHPIDLSANRKIEIIQAHNCGLSGTINWSGFAHLRYVGFHSSSITAIDVSDCPNLTRLDCYHNQLTSLNITGCSKLQYIFCWNNQLTSLDVSGCGDLRELKCSNNLLTALDLSGCHALKKLSCAFNKLTALDLTHCWALEEIECQYNQLTALNFAQNKMLTKVDCYSNSIEVNAMQTLVESLPTVSSGELVPVFYNDSNEHNYITDEQAAIATAKGWTVRDLWSDDFEEKLVIDQNHFPDKNFRNYVRENVDTDGNGGLTSAEIDAVVTMDVSSREIADLTGIEYFTALQQLICDNNQLTALDLSANTALTNLSCTENQLTTLTLTGCDMLKVLSCAANQLASLNLNGYTALTTVNCADNQLTSLTLTGCTALTRVQCNDNKLATLGVSSNTALQHLECSGNLITTLSVSGCTALEELSCADNKLSTLSVSGLTLLEELNCSGNQLTGLDVSSNRLLLSLSCSDNRLTSLTVSNNAALQLLECANNQLPELNLEVCISLKMLDCSGNWLTSLDLSQNTALEVLLCHNNRLTSLTVSPQATNLTLMTCHINKLNGTAVDNLIASLPTLTEAWGYLYLLDKRASANDQNNCTQAQALTASGKHWKVAQYLSDGSVALIYDPDAIATGDVNGDGNLSIADVMAIVNYILGLLPDDFYPEAADMNNDDDITITDATIILSRILNE